MQVLANTAMKGGPHVFFRQVSFDVVKIFKTSVLDVVMWSQEPTSTSLILLLTRSLHMRSLFMVKSGSHNEDEQGKRVGARSAHAFKYLESYPC